MHLWTIFAFASLLWRAENPPGYWLLPRDSVGWTLVMALGLPLIIGLAGSWAARRATHKLVVDRAPHQANHDHHRATWILRTALIVGFCGLVLGTPWPDWFQFERYSPWLQIFGDVIVLLPFVAGTLLLWLSAHPFERAVRKHDGAGDGDTPWHLRSYLDFNLRHQLLVVAVPMLLILFVADIARGYEKFLIEHTGIPFAPDLVLGVAAAVVFVISPLLLRRIWRTEPLGPGDVRDRLEALGERIHLRFRDILVWNSDHSMINAAVMGVFPQVRYVLLSDALLDNMTPEQIEAVFGHEAGHIRHHHIPNFLIFAVVGWFLVIAIMEGLARLSLTGHGWWRLSESGIENVGLFATAAFWALGFGWISRQFERQADVFGARCVTREPNLCREPCSVHLDEPGVEVDARRVCSGGAMVFASALERVAALNGIPRDEPSWRHGSIGSRIRFLVALAGDPARAVRFERHVARVKWAMTGIALLGGLVMIGYWYAVGRPAILQM